ncbi:MAG: DUF2975 domain-containing protein [Eubacteriaceae bacterium]|nr:DUF2975 domain-containing protein [Eubacteriaceae bacterium]
MVFIALIAMALFLPRLTILYMGYKAMDSSLLTRLLVILYTAVLPAFWADTSLILLLKDVKERKVFTSSAVKKLSSLACCCFAETVIFLILSIYFRFSLLLSFAALFMGVILMVVSRVIDEATQIKAENDSTI